MESKDHPIEKENHLNQMLPFVGFQMWVFLVKFSYQAEAQDGASDNGG